MCRVSRIDRLHVHRHRLLMLLLGAALPLSGCESGQFNMNRPEWLGGAKKPPPEPAPPARSPRETDPLFVGTIGGQTLLSNVAPLRLRGFGLVVGLGENGSDDCPTVIREYLVEFMTKSLGTRMPTDPNRRASPEQIIDSYDSAVVEVQALVPAGAPRGARLDLRVDVLPGTSTRSLEGGLLLPCELRLYGESVTRDGLLAGEVLAEAQGPVFTNPLATEGSDRRYGVVLSGGRTRAEREARLILTDPTYGLSRKIERRLNERFGQSPRVAEALSKGFVTLRTPPAYAARPERFLELVGRVYLEDTGPFAEEKLRELAATLPADPARTPQLALLLEGFGRRAISYAQSFYTHGDPLIRFYAARTGVRLGDVQALPVLAEIAATPAHPQRLVAIAELGASALPRAAVTLPPLLKESDRTVRLAAYEALLEQRHPAVRVMPLRHRMDASQINFILDVVETEGPPLLYIRRTRAPRIVVFGPRMEVTQPAFYAHADDLVTITSTPGSSDLAVFGKVRGRLSERRLIPPRVVELIEALGALPPRPGERRGGLGLVFAQVIQVLDVLCQDGAIRAEFFVEPTGPLDILTPTRTPTFERPETDEDADQLETQPAEPPLE